MIGQFGSIQFGNDGYLSSNRIGKYVACVGDTGDHGGSIINSGGNSTVFVKGILIALNGCSYSCANPLHGVTSVTANTTKSYGPGGKLIVTQGATAGCGSRITPVDRMVYVE